MTTGDTRSILLAGVGGQGILRASDILANVFMEAGLDVKKSEVHGMAQRGGCVTSHVRYGRKVFSPLALKSDVDILLAFEKLEALRYLDYLKADGSVIINDQEILPPSVNLGDLAYPADVVAAVKSAFPSTKVVRAEDLARSAGNIRTVNTVLLGVLSSFLTGIDISTWEKVLKDSFPAKLTKVNLDAFHLGRSA
ncbi:MAG: indolepyruvate oxidoreductase subunit beta [Syntrophaceae bacterium PtaU1.Bin231]|nr:MAG: indolepyruvate oxidoreductase subunit beta [Syntrophaceae bacterium PtaU1.Bin231]